MIEDALRGWLLGIIAAGMVLAVLYALLPRGRIQTVAAAAGGTILLLVIVRPVLRIDPEAIFDDYDDCRLEIEALAESYRQANEDELTAIIEGKTAAYIANRYSASGTACTVRVTTELRDGIPYPDTVTLDIPRDEALSAWISTELGIDSAHQYWREVDG